MGVSSEGNRVTLMERVGVSAADRERYRGMLDFVKECLAKPQKDQEHVFCINFDRYLHTERVLSWALRLYDGWEDKSRIDLDALITATIFHDYGYPTCDDLKDHAEESARIAAEYLPKAGYGEERAEFITELVRYHGEKSWLTERPSAVALAGAASMTTDGAIPDELTILMEADLFDDMGVMGIVMDTWIQAQTNAEVTFESIRDHINKYTLRLQYKDREKLRSDVAKKLWDEKTKLVQDFYDSLCTDLELPM